MDSSPSKIIGNCLRQKREEQLLTLEDVASRLFLRKALIDNIENGNCEEIPSPYLRGYWRLYAKILSISEKDIFLLQETPLQVASTSGWQFFHSYKEVTAGDKYIQWITYSIISMLVILVALWWKSDNSLTINLNATDNTAEDQPYAVAQNKILEIKE